MTIFFILSRALGQHECCPYMSNERAPTLVPRTLSVGLLASSRASLIWPSLVSIRAVKVSAEVFTEFRTYFLDAQPLVTTMAAFNNKRNESLCIVLSSENFRLSTGLTREVIATLVPFSGAFTVVGVDAFQSVQFCRKLAETLVSLLRSGIQLI